MIPLILKVDSDWRDLSYIEFKFFNKRRTVYKFKRV